MHITFNRVLKDPEKPENVRNSNFCQDKPEEPENVRKMTCFDLPKNLFVYYGLVSESVLFEHVPEMCSEGT